MEKNCKNQIAVRSIVGSILIAIGGLLGYCGLWAYFGVSLAFGLYLTITGIHERDYREMISKIERIEELLLENKKDD